MRSLPLSVAINNALLTIKFSKVQIDDVLFQLAELKKKNILFIIPLDNHLIYQKAKKLILKNVSFGYNKDKNIFNNLNIEFNENKIIGIQGDNGSGKSTLVDLIAGFEQILEV